METTHKINGYIITLRRSANGLEASATLNGRRVAQVFKSHKTEEALELMAQDLEWQAELDYMNAAEGLR